MRGARRWTDQDLRALTERQYGLVSAPAPPLSVEAEAIRLARLRVTRRKLEAVFEQHLTWTGMRGLFEAQFRFHPQRKWRLDYYCARFQLGIEIHGAVHSAGRHTRGEGFEADREKMNAAHERGITVLEFTGVMLEDGSAIAQVERMLEARGWRRAIRQLSPEDPQVIGADTS